MCKVWISLGRKSVVWFMSKSSTVCAEEIPTEFLIRKLPVMCGYSGHLGDQSYV